MRSESAVNPSLSGGLYDGFEAYVTASSDELREALKSSLVVFDTNVLLNMYRYNAETRTSITDVMAALGERLWIPHHVLEEFWRNRERALSEPLSQVRQSAADLVKLKDSAKEILRIWVNRAALGADEAAVVENGLEAAFESAGDLMDGLLDETEIARAKNTHLDPVLQLLEPVLANRVGTPMTKVNFNAAVKEGLRRANAGEPPGFGDARKAERVSEEAAAGDYLVWEQLLTEASTRGRDVVFVTGDVKRDWWRYEGSSARGPRVELVREMRGRCGVQLTMMRPETLLALADAIAVSVGPAAVQDVERATRTEPASNVQRAEATGWTTEALDTLLNSLSREAPVQEATIRLACQQDGYVSREDVYRLGEYEPDRKLSGFTRPVNRLVQYLRDSGAVPSDACDALVPVYDEQRHGFGWVDGFRVPSELLELASE